MLLSIQGGSDLGLFEINEAARLVQEAAHPEANIIFGAVIDDALGDEVRVTVIAAGFDGGGPVQRNDDRALGQIAGSTGRQQAQEQPRQQTYQHVAAAGPLRAAGPEPAGAGPRVPAAAGAEPPGAAAAAGRAAAGAAEPARQQEPVARPPRTVTFDDNDDLDVPDFLK